MYISVEGDPLLFEWDQISQFKHLKQGKFPWKWVPFLSVHIVRWRYSLPFIHTFTAAPMQSGMAWVHYRILLPIFNYQRNLSCKSVSFSHARSLAHASPCDINCFVSFFLSLLYGGVTTKFMAKWFCHKHALAIINSLCLRSAIATRSDECHVHLDAMHQIVSTTFFFAWQFRLNGTESDWLKVINKRHSWLDHEMCASELVCVCAAGCWMVSKWKVNQPHTDAMRYCLNVNKVEKRKKNEFIDHDISETLMNQLTGSFTDWKPFARYSLTILFVHVNRYLDDSVLCFIIFKDQKWHSAFMRMWMWM